MTLFSDRKHSKIVNLFKVRDKNLREIATESDLIQRIDLVIFFSGHMLTVRALDELIPNYVMRKEITR